MKFRKKPVVIEAFQFRFTTGCEWNDMMPVEGMVRRSWRRGWWVKTLEGWYPVNLGDWIITGVEGERYPIKDSIFRATYEKVEETP